MTLHVFSSYHSSEPNVMPSAPVPVAMEGFQNTWPLGKLVGQPDQKSQMGTKISTSGTSRYEQLFRDLTVRRADR
jgi:hypothetical protein